MEEKASNLDEENKMLRQVVASIPTIKSTSTEKHETPNIQVPAMSICKLLHAGLPIYRRQSITCWIAIAKLMIVVHIYVGRKVLIMRKHQMVQ